MKNNKKATITGTEKNGVITFNGKTIELADVNSRFDGFRKTANALPEGKQKKTMLNEIEGFYHETVGWLKDLAATPVQAS